MRTTRRLLAATLAVFGLAASACGGDAADTSTTKLVVFAASSLTGAFTDIGTAFAAAHPGTDVTFNFAGSGDLVNQIGEGAPADVFASADDATMTKLIDARLNDGAPVSIARNRFEIIVEHGNPRGITGLADLADPELIVVLCADTVPCGRGAADLLARAGVSITPKSLENKVKGVVTKVTTGEADAGIVYTTDVLAAGGAADGVEIPTDVNTTTSSSMVVIGDARHPATARMFIEFVAGAAGQAILTRYGFLAP
ncbi:MAG: molybdate ABC transporter substrate-binding protein [Ilumatobacteraceae bacterium]